MIEIIGILWIIYCLLFIASIYLKDNSIADIFWGLWFVTLSWLLYDLEKTWSFSHIFVYTCITIWWGRLFYLFMKRKQLKSSEDQRYAQWRKQWKYFYTRSFFQVYMLQMILMLVVATPLFLIFWDPNLDPRFTLLGWIIALLWLAYEIIADKQITEFVKNKKKWENLVYTQWLWKYSRNPNYFWESIFWLGISIISLPISYFGIIWYITITFLLLCVSGVPMKEKHQAKKDNWHAYAAKTNMFIPWFSKK